MADRTADLGEQLFPAVDGRLDAVVARDRSGYHFQMWLPGPEGTWRHEGEAGPVDAAGAASAYRCAAWPNEGAGKRAFFGDEQGAVYACNNRYRVYQGAARPVPITAMLLPVCRIEPPETPSTGAVWTEVQ